MAFSPTRREEICRLARQISSHSMQLKDIVDNIYKREQSPAASSPRAASPTGFTAQQSVMSGGGKRRKSAPAPAAPEMAVNAKVMSGGPSSKGATTQYLTVQVPVSMASQFMATQKLDAGEVSVRQSVSGSLGSDEGAPKEPTTTHISRRPKPPPPPKPKSATPEPEPEHPRPYDDDPIWQVWENNMLRLIQLLKMLLQELCNVSDYTKMDDPALAAAAVGAVNPADLMGSDVYANKIAASAIIGGIHNLDNVANALSNPPPFPKMYGPPPPPPKMKNPSLERLSSDPPRERIDLSVYFRKLATQMDALTQSLKPNPYPPHDGAPMANRAEHRASLGGPPQPQVQLHAEAQVDSEGNLVSAANRANVSFQLDRSLSSMPQSSSIPSSSMSGKAIQSDTTAPLVASVNRLSQHMNEVHDMFRKAMGAKPLPKKKTEGLTIAEEEDLRYCINKLTDNMGKMSKDLRKAMDEHTVVPLSTLVDELDDEEEDEDDGGVGPGYCGFTVARNQRGRSRKK
ncbi:hypothetical protein V5799_002839 [Amblyomma americanum]|uniref:Uncharacterized protein n=1 Tax=Amblyomma americanum TaxID=6943 RepID=A0AAQ4DAP2_AMBAM